MEKGSDMLSWIGAGLSFLALFINIGFSVIRERNAKNALDRTIKAAGDRWRATYDPDERKGAVPGDFGLEIKCSIEQGNDVRSKKRYEIKKLMITATLTSNSQDEIKVTGIFLEIPKSIEGRAKKPGEPRKGKHYFKDSDFIFTHHGERKFRLDHQDEEDKPILDAINDKKLKSILVGVDTPRYQEAQMSDRKELKIPPYSSHKKSGE